MPQETTRFSLCRWSIPINQRRASCEERRIYGNNHCPEGQISWDCI